MPSIRISKKFNNGIYFLTLSVKNLYYLFDRHYRWNILADSLKLCQNSKGLLLYEFVFMLNHVHLIVSSPDVAGFIRDFKKFTSKKIRQNMEINESNVLKLFLAENGNYEFWEKTNMPKLIESEDFYMQKVEYIRNNPIKKEYVMKPEDWYWSSANNSYELKTNKDSYFELQNGNNTVIARESSPALAGLDDPAYRQAGAAISSLARKLRDCHVAAAPRNDRLK